MIKEFLSNLVQQCCRLLRLWEWKSQDSVTMNGFQLQATVGCVLLKLKNLQSMIAEGLSNKQRMEKVKDETEDPSRETVARESSGTVDVGGFGGFGISGNGISTFRDIELSSEDFSFIVKSGAFVDKTLLIKTFYPEEEWGNIKKVLITAPHRFGKSVNMNMLKRFFEIVVDENGNPMKCVKKNEAGKWIEDERETPTENFVLFKDNNLKVYQCQCKPGHTEEQMKSGQCSSRQYFYEHCGQHPVLFVSFEDLHCDTWDELVSSFRILLNEVFKRYNYLQSSNRLSQDQKEYFDRYASDSRFESLSKQQILNGLKRLVYYLYTHFNNKKVIVLIDELDAPIMRLIRSSKDNKLSYINDVTRFINEVVSNLFKGNEYVLGGLMNACVLLSTVLSSDANNIMKCPFLENHEFSTFYGFTEHEVEELLNRPQFTVFNQQAILNYYNGYTVLEEGTKIYSVYSIVKYLEDWKLKQQISDKFYIPRSYWVEDHGITDLKKLFGIEKIHEAILMVLHEGEYIARPKNKRVPSDILELKKLLGEYNISPLTDQVNLFLLYLKDRGYFNIIKKKAYSYTLSIPSDEIRDELTRQLYDGDYYKKKYDYTCKQISDYCNALLSLDVNKPETLEELANSIEQLFSGGVPMPKNHDEFKAPLAAFANGMLHTTVFVEMRFHPWRNYRLDLLIRLQNIRTGIIMELKWGSNENAENGLKQIFDKQYYKAFEQFDIDNKICIGVHFSELKKVSICAASTNAEEWYDVKKNLIKYPKSEN